ncbi:heme NO-binding domain-containing protein [Natrinema longum]|uniref:Heme NO-binding domain-containing protein n=1 Tax=Natrinema longum TaxID=370324 RepID=A0A8A2U499_9EURY|nr:heme NO-binding domain-containing protein [Natrinema longum]MBZ6494977.1 heme NO-binding domain-containing protein [Natrinema longum]QSW83727.1 heme NO-binding domain-containing protein [Natrinema longum]
MHGIVHKTLKEYVVDRTDDGTWDTIVEQSGLEPKLYLPVSHYEDEEIDAILETLSTMATQDRRAIERDFGKTLAPELLSTFSAHVQRDQGLPELLVGLEDAYSNINTATEETSLPAVSATRESDSVTVTYDTARDQQYCGLAHGILEGLATAFDADATVTETECVDDGADTCQFRVVLE